MSDANMNDARFDKSAARDSDELSQDELNDVSGGLLFRNEGSNDARNAGVVTRNANSADAATADPSDIRAR